MVNSWLVVGGWFAASLYVFFVKIQKFSINDDFHFIAPKRICLSSCQNATMLNVRVSLMQTLKSELRIKQPQVLSLIERSSLAIHQAAAVCDVTTDQSDLARLQAGWPALLASVETQSARLTELGVVSLNYHAQLSTARAWLSLMEEKLNLLQPLDKPDETSQNRITADQTSSKYEFASVSL